MTDIPSLIERLRAWKSLDLEAAAQALQQHARENERQYRDIAVKAKLLTQQAGRIRELEAEIIRLAEPPNPPLTMNDALALLNAQAREIERLKNEVLAPLPPCMMPDGGECCPQYHTATARISELRETLAGMHCPHQINAGTIAECTGRLECGCHEGAVFVKTEKLT